MNNYLPPVNFSFDGKHCYHDFGMVWIFSQRPASPAQQDPGIAIGGMSGTVRFESDEDEPVYLPMKWSGMLCPMTEPTSQLDAWQRWHEITDWLRAGRRELILDSEPDRRYMAEVLEEIEWDESNWDEGELRVTFLIQPYAEDAKEKRLISDLAASGEMDLVLQGNRNSPVSFEIQNSSYSAYLTGVHITVGKREVQLSGMKVGYGGTLVINMEPPIGAEIVSRTAGTYNALPYADRFDYLRGKGHVVAQVVLTYDASGGAVTVTMTGRGRYV